MKHSLQGKICLFHVTIHIKLLYCYWTQGHSLCPNNPCLDIFPSLSYLNNEIQSKKKKMDISFKGLHWKEGQRVALNHPNTCPYLKSQGKVKV